MTDANSTVGTLSCLSRLALIRITGADRLSFLQGQLTNDVFKLGDGLMCAGWCSPKGRLLCTPRLFQKGEAVGMITAASNVEYVVKRLKMYVLRSKVTVEIDPDFTVAGYVGRAPEALPEDALCFALTGGTPEACMAAAVPSSYGLAVVPKNTPLAAGLEPLWWAASAAAGSPWVFGESAERFTPHAVNLDLVDGVSFTKGCYTGQEIVSRIEHIGKTNRRTAFFAAPKALEFAPGSDIAAADGTPTATVVYAAPRADRTLILAEVPADLALAGGNLETADGSLHRLPLPYGWTRSEKRTA